MALARPERLLCRTGNLTVYYSLRQSKSEDFRGPDFFVVLETERKPRKSWTVWEEDGKYPNVIIELLSESTAKTDRELKKQIYQDTFRLPEYFWFSPDSLEFQGFALVQNKYEPMPLKDIFLGRSPLALLGLRPHLKVPQFWRI